MILNVKGIVLSILGRVMVIVTTVTTYAAATGMAAIAVLPRARIKQTFFRRARIASRRAKILASNARTMMKTPMSRPLATGFATRELGKSTTLQNAIGMEATAVSRLAKMANFLAALWGIPAWIQ